MDTRSPRVQRSPRLVPPLPKEEHQIPAPPPPPTSPQMQPLSLLLSVLPGLMGALITFLITRRATYLFFSLPMMLSGLLIQVSLFLFQRNRFAKALNARNQAYQERLAQSAGLCHSWAEQQRTIMLDQAPPPQACTQRIMKQGPRLWERRPTDFDFLLLRLGTGTASASFTVTPPKSFGSGEPDPLLLEATRLAERAGVVTDLPVSLPVPALSAVGLVGPRERVLAGMRAILLQVVCHHAPDEVQIAAIFPAAEATDWLSLRWLPHTWADSRQRRLLAATPEGARDLLSHVQALVERRRTERARDGALDAQGTCQLPHLLIVAGAQDLAPDHPAWPLLLRDGPAVGIHLLFLADRRESLPAQVDAICVYADGQAELMRTEPHLVREAICPDLLAAVDFDAVARRLAPLRLGDQREGSIPTRVELLSLFGAEQVENWDLLSTWAGSRPWETLSVPLGLGAGGVPIRLDLHERGDGPHGLAAGATGSGKSELLQTLIAALALRYHPHEVALMLVDYKGGGMANAFAGLPHLTGVITNLEGGQSRRALASLRAELKRRQRILAEAGLNHVDAYIRQRRADPKLEPLPHLIVIVDEFAELKAEQPDFMRELVSAVRVGRSLGVHLLLATQKPAGVVDEQIWSNARFRLCLRVERREDSMEVLKSPVAAALDRPGLCWLQVGSGERMVQFQAGWGGAPYQPDAAHADPITVAEVTVEGVRQPLTAPPSRAADAPSQLAALVAFIRQGAELAGLIPVPGPWLPPLPEEIDLDSLLPVGEGLTGVHERWSELVHGLNPVIGLMDDPDGQRQIPLQLPFTKNGHLAVIGAPGSGKSTLLQTLLLSLAQTIAPSQLHTYVVDGAGRNLVILTALPHMAAVILADDAERLRRLGRYFQAELAARKERIGQSGAGTWSGFRQVTGEAMPALLLCVDNLPSLLAVQPDLEELLALIGREGAAFGIYVVITAPSWNAIRPRLLQSIGQTIALTLHDRSEYAAIVGRTGGLVPAAAPGRGLVRAEPPLEFQTALPATGVTEWERQAALQARVARVAEAWTGSRPEPIRSLPAEIPLGDLLAKPLPDSPASRQGNPTGGRLHPLRPIPVGLEVDSLTPFGLDLRESPVTLVAGLPAAGKTSLLATILGALAARHSPVEVEAYIFDLGGSGIASLAELHHVRGLAADPATAAALIDGVAEELRRRRVAWASPEVEEGLDPNLVLVIDDIELFRDLVPQTARDRLESLVRRERGLGMHLIVAGAPVAFSNGFDGLTKALREVQVGFLLGTAEPAEGSLFGVRLPAVDGSRFLPPGHGFFIRRGRLRAIKAALIPAGEGLPNWVHCGERKEQEYDADPGRSRAVAVPGQPVR